MPPYSAAPYAINLTLKSCAPRRTLRPWPSWHQPAHHISDHADPAPVYCPNLTTLRSPPQSLLAVSDAYLCAGLVHCTPLAALFLT